MKYSFQYKKTTIALRTAIAKNKKFYVQAGAGIVADSKPLNEYGCEIPEPMEINYRDFSETGIDEKVVIWGHNGMFSYTYNFNEVDQFSIDKLKIFLLKLEEDIFITGITYDDQDPDDEEPDFAPKHGYWGPYIY